MHDIVRDFTLAAHSEAELQQWQASFVQTLITAVSASAESKSHKINQSYAHTLLSYHVRSAVTRPLHSDPLVVDWLMNHDESGLFTDF
jgi:hypothetical protein